MRGMKVLIAESSPVDAKMLREILVETGADVLVVHDAESALSEMKRFVPDMVLMDVFFPDMSGLEVSRRIRSSEGDGEWTPVMFVSASDHDSDFETAMEAGADWGFQSQAIRRGSINGMDSLSSSREAYFVGDVRYRPFQEIQRFRRSCRS